MLFKKDQLEGIRNGMVTKAYRKWQRPRVKTGTVLHTYIGLVEVLKIIPIDPKALKDSDAKAAGFEQVSHLQEALNRYGSGQVYEIDVIYRGEDPRIAMRNHDTLSKDELTAIMVKLERYDKYSKTGPWTEKILTLIQGNPKVRALDLATRIGVEKDWLKINVRKLKNLGLTVSHGVGYSISPRGAKILKHLLQSEDK